MFTKVISFENSANKVRDAGGGYKGTFVGVVTTRGFMRKLSGGRVFDDNSYSKLVEEYECFTFWRSMFENEFTKDTRIVYENKSYQIHEIERYQENRQFMRFVCVVAK